MAILMTKQVSVSQAKTVTARDDMPGSNASVKHGPAISGPD
jgi:hypothetical protein